MLDDLTPTTASDSDRSDTLRISRRGFVLKLAAAGGATAMVVIGHSTFGHAATANDPVSSPGASPVASPEASPAAASMVTIASFAFTPPILHISVGSEVTWVNTDSVAHTVTSDDKAAFSSPPLQQNDHFTFRFASAGALAYHCNIHPSMTAQVIVS